MNNVYIRTEAICLHPENRKGETLVLTEKCGPVRIYRLKDRRGIMDIGSVLNVLLEYKGYYYLKESEHINNLEFVDIEALSVVSFFTKLFSMIPENSISEWSDLYELYYDLLLNIKALKPYLNKMLFFQLKLLASLGLMGDVKHCSVCGIDLNKKTGVFTALEGIELFCRPDKPIFSAELMEKELQVLADWSKPNEISLFFGKNSLKRMQAIFITIFTRCLNLSNQEKFLDTFYKIVDDC